jgi:hypothetical protein
MNSFQAEQGKRKKKPGRKRGWRYFRYLFFTFILVAIFYTLIMAYLSPVKKIEELTKAAQLSDDGKNGFHPSDDPGYLKLLKEESFLKSRLAMAAQDSVCLTVDLLDSLVTLEIQGVVVHKVKASKILKSSLFDHINPQVFIKRFSYPQDIDSVDASFQKLVFTEKEAPADTNQQTELVIPDTAKIDPAYVRMFLNSDVILTLREGGILNKKEITKISRQRQLEYSLNFLKEIGNFKIPDYTPWIEVEIPGRDIRTIYRSIPHKAIVTVRI